MLGTHKIDSTVNRPMPPRVAAAYTWCAQLAASHYENFPVASRLLPKHLRQEVSVIYAFARLADDFADEPQFQGERLVRLNQWHDQLLKAATSNITTSTHPVFIALQYCLQQYALPVQLLEDLLTAFKMDVLKKQYANFEQVLHYCRHSANPVGRLVLHLFGFHPDKQSELFQRSDQVCTGLQLANFWQDLSIDIHKPRYYLPEDEMRAHGYSLRELQAGVMNDNYRRLMQFQVARAADFLTQGMQIVKLVPAPLAWELKLTCLGGLRILRKIEKMNYNSLGARPRLYWYDYAGLCRQWLLGASA